jgi:hypothetical protein
MYVKSPAKGKLVTWVQPEDERAGWPSTLMAPKILYSGQHAKARTWRDGIVYIERFFGIMKS